MGKVIAGLIAVIGIWMGVEMVSMGPSRAFDGLFADLFSSPSGSSSPGASASPGIKEVDRPSTAQRAGRSVTRARDDVEARRERMLGE